MTFIASVIAKEGIAIVADSFVTTVEHSLDEQTFLTYLQDVPDKDNIPIRDLIQLFERRASHTRNFVDKLFQFDRYSAVTITGAAYINGKEIKDIVKLISIEMQADEGVYRAKNIFEILQEFCDRLKIEVIEHLKNNNLTATDFIFSHFNIQSNEPQIFVIKIKESNKDSFDPADLELVKYDDQTNLGIVTDGQDSFVDRLIFGSLYTNVSEIKIQLLNKVIETLNLEGEAKQKIIAAIDDFEFLKETVTKDMFSINFRELSLQEALNLAALLIKIVMDIQVYTEKIPTVGGLIRLAVIHKDAGFEWISGNKIEPSNIIVN